MIIQQGAYDDRYVTVEIPPEIDSPTVITSIDSFLDYIKNYSKMNTYGIVFILT